MTQLRTNVIAYINKLLIKTLEFYLKCYISDIHWVSTGENQNPKPNLISFGYPNPKIMGKKSNPNPLDPKSMELQPKTAPLPSLIAIVPHCRSCSSPLLSSCSALVHIAGVQMHELLLSTVLTLVLTTVRSKGKCNKALLALSSLLLQTHLLTNVY
jgi:hypothetical protein